MVEIELCQHYTTLGKYALEQVSWYFALFLCEPIKMLRATEFFPLFEYFILKVSIRGILLELSLFHFRGHIYDTIITKRHLIQARGEVQRLSLLSHFVGMDWSFG